MKKKVDVHFYGTGNAFSIRPNTSFGFELCTNLKTIFIFEVPMSTTKQIIDQGHLIHDNFDNDSIASIVICISHLHEDHAGGLSTLLAWFKYAKKIPLEDKVTIICPNIDDMETYLDLTLHLPNKQNPVITEQYYRMRHMDAMVEIQPEDVVHCKGMNSVGFDVTVTHPAESKFATQFRFYYTGDCIEIPPHIVSQFNKHDIDILISEISEFPIESWNVHCSYEFFKKNFNPEDIRNRIIFVHYNFDYKKVLNLN